MFGQAAWWVHSTGRKGEVVSLTALSCNSAPLCLELRDNARTRTRRDLEEVSSAQLSGGLQEVMILIQE